MPQRVRNSCGMSAEIYFSRAQSQFSQKRSPMRGTSRCCRQSRVVGRVTPCAPCLPKTGLIWLVSVWSAARTE